MVVHLSPLLLQLVQHTAGFCRTRSARGISSGEGEFAEIDELVSPAMELSGQSTDSAWIDWRRGARSHLTRLCLQASHATFWPAFVNDDKIRKGRSNLGSGINLRRFFLGSSDIVWVGIRVMVWGFVVLYIINNAFAPRGSGLSARSRRSTQQNVMTYTFVTRTSSRMAEADELLSNYSTYLGHNPCLKSFWYCFPLLTWQVNIPLLRALWLSWHCIPSQDVIRCTNNPAITSAKDTP